MIECLHINSSASSIFLLRKLAGRARFRFHTALLFLVLLALVACTPEHKLAPDQGRSESLALTILHTNDVHSAYSGLTAEGRI